MGQSKGAAGQGSSGSFGEGAPVYDLCLYVAGTTARSTSAIVNVRRLCEKYLKGKYTLEVVDVLEHPEIAQAEQLLALPTLVKRQPGPVRRFIGDLAHPERLLLDLDLPPMNIA